MGRTKSSDSLIENNTFSYARLPNLEITGLEQWMEGPMAITNVSVTGNSFLGTPDGNRNVHPSEQATNITVSKNYPLISVPAQNNRTATPEMWSQDRLEPRN